MTTPKPDDITAHLDKMTPEQLAELLQAAEDLAADGAATRVARATIDKWFPMQGNQDERAVNELCRQLAWKITMACRPGSTDAAVALRHLRVSAFLAREALSADE